MTSRLRPLPLLAAAAMLVAACGSTATPRPSAPAATPGASSPTILPVPITGAFRVGDNRIVFTLTDPGGQKQIAKPERTLSIGYHGPNGEAIAPAPMTFVWAVEGANGVYVGHATFPTAGNWTADFVTAAPGAAQEQLTFGFEVHQTIDVLSPGEMTSSFARTSNPYVVVSGGAPDWVVVKSAVQAPAVGNVACPT